MDVDGVIRRKKYHVDTTALAYAKAGMEISSYLKDGMIDNWDVLEQLLDYSYDKVWNLL